ncbi:class I SAM-dependent methyltransferase [Microlunatus speluncae]|uniref:class I SAM-dependent methyltransferase n=1 Tax=Microlunatus speluncae TaxID=2594267 RepID=UPI0012665764|nr:class I SAM-dependent methyltransferase [Microlunatus speluncae]
MDELRDYVEWHHKYDDPNSGMSWRLATVQRWLRRELDDRAGPVRLLSICAGDGRDILGVLADRDDANRVEVVLLELNDDLADRAELAAARLDQARVDVRRGDAGRTAAYDGIGRFDIVLLVGIFGNITDLSIRRTIEFVPELCVPGAFVVWSRGRSDGDRNPQIRTWFAESGFAEVEYATREDGFLPAVGSVRWTGESRSVEAGAGIKLFKFHY